MLLHVVINLRSSASRRALPGLLDRFVRHGLTVAQLSTAEGHEPFIRTLHAMRKAGAKAIVVGGGDGTMMVAANELAHTGTAMGVLPLGTGNSFAQTLNVGTDLDAALEVIAGGRTADVDLGRVNGRYFANFATIGLPARIAAAAPHALKPIFGPFAYVIGGIVPFLRARSFRAKIRWPEGKLRIETQQIVIASGRYFGKTPVLPTAEITDGRLAFFTTEGGSRFDAACTFVAFALGRQTQLPNAHTCSTDEICIRTKRKQPINLDGDAAGMTPAHFSVARRALRVFVPATFVDSGK